MRPVRRAVDLVGLPLVLLAVWWVASAGSESPYFPPLSEILRTSGEVWLGERLRADVLPSVLRLAAGYGLAVAVALPLGVLIGSSRTLRATLEPVLEFLRAVPPPVLVPVVMLVVGIGDAMRVAVIASGAVWPVLLNTVEGVRAVDPTVADTARAYGITGGARLRHVVLPSAGPQIATGMRQALSVAIILMVISELFAASNGLGFAVVQFQRSFAVPQMWSGILLLGLLGSLLSLLFRLVERRRLAWYHGLRRTQRPS